MPGRETATIVYDGRRTLIIGDVNTGKTRLTENYGEMDHFQVW